MSDSVFRKKKTLFRKQLRTVFCILLLFTAYRAQACKCTEHPALTIQQCAVYDLIFEGRVDSVSNCRDGYSLAYMSLIVLYKGHTEEQIAMRFDCSSDCQMSFVRGDRWIMYAQYYKYGKPEVNFCSRSRKKTDAGEDYFETLNHMTYAAEASFLQDTFGVQKPSPKENSAFAERKLIQPTAYWKLWLLLISMIVLYVIFYLVKKMP